MGRRRVMQDNGDTPTGGLTPQQLAAVDLLVTGKTLTDTAAALGVDRVTVSGWVNHYAAFIAALNARRQESFDGMVERLRGLLPQALDVIERELKLDGSQAMAAAIQVLKSCGLAAGLGRPSGPATVEEAESAQRQREVERTLTAVSAKDVEHAQRRREQDRMMAELLL